MFNQVTSWLQQEPKVSGLQERLKKWFKCGLKASKGVFKEGKKETLTRLKREHKRGGERKLQKAQSIHLEEKEEEPCPVEAC